MNVKFECFIRLVQKAKCIKLQIYFDRNIFWSITGNWRKRLKYFEKNVVIPRKFSQL